VVCFIHGLPELIEYERAADGQKPAPVTQILNFRREVFRDRSICAFFWLVPETAAYLSTHAPDFWSFRAGSVRFSGTGAAPAQEVRKSDRLEQSDFQDRWSGDLEEKLSQLAAYRRRSPPDESAIGNLLLEIGSAQLNAYHVEAAFDALHDAEEIFGRLKDI